VSEVEVEVAIVGAGFAGLCAAAELARRTTRSFVVLERAGDVGGTWRDNVYPGVACDVPSHLYSYSFAPNPNWSHTYSGGAEILAYLRDVASRFGLWDRIRFGADVCSATWSAGRWELEIEGGRTVRARFLIGALGALNVPNVPVIPGFESFAGPAFHTAQWPRDLDLTGLRVGMIGTGATAVQAAPEVAKMAAGLWVFQRSPVWALPKRDRFYTEEERAEFARDPGALRQHRWELWDKLETRGVDLIHAGTRANANAERLARHNISDHVDSDELIAALTPGYVVNCKRPTLSNDYYPMFNDKHVHLVTERIERIEPAGTIVGGRSVPLDCLVLATGFTPFDITKQIDLVGLDGRRLAKAWSSRIVSYRSVMVSGFPNFFMLLGPNSGGLTSAVQMIEAGARFARQAMDMLDERGAVALHPIEDYMDEFVAMVDSLSQGSTISSGCRSWWTDEAGVNHALWPDSSISYRMLLAELRDHHFNYLQSA
jgi:cation diffusion facilitator CzcD-associated flavoprotein CzcO